MQKILSIVVFSFFIPLVSFAGTGLQLTNIPFVSGGGIGGVVQGLFMLAIVLAGMLAVVKLVIAGAKYMMSDVVTTKQSAISDIKGAIIGLLLVLGTVLILDTINSDITNANLQLEPLNIRQAQEVQQEEVGSGNQSGGTNSTSRRDQRAGRDQTGTGEQTDTAGSGSRRNQRESTETGSDTSSEVDTGTETTGSSDNQTQRPEFDPEQTYTFNEPAIPEFDLPAGERDQQSFTITDSFYQGGSVDLNLPNSGQQSSGGGAANFSVEFADGTSAVIPCGSISPRPAGC